MELSVGGRWSLDTSMPAVAPLIATLTGVPEQIRLTITGGALEAWDGTLIAFLLPVLDCARQRQATIVYEKLPAGLLRLIDLAEAVPDRGEVAVRASPPTIARWARARRTQATAVVAFLGEVFIAATTVVRRRAVFPWRDFNDQVELCGARALPIISVISFLIGMIIAFVGALELRRYGASAYVANLVGLATAREMAPVMTAVVMAGRTGAAFAAELGAMRSDEEVDALTVMGISPYVCLVLPRLFALLLMMPLLCLYADLLGMIGGYSVAHAMLGISAAGFFHQLAHYLALYQVAVGFVKSGVFAVIVAVAGCYYGLTAGRSAAGVGMATTGAVVASILFVVVADGIFAVVLQTIGL